ncbi:MAG: hypothetical protein EOP05_15310 [Proteobacteria bacterium]|nr:MAG: hypothetical protein EOP05_15310 [Pseudomonadota bacterium]
MSYQDSKSKEAKATVDRWNLLSWTSPVVALGLFVLLFTASVGQGQSDPQARRILGSGIERGSTNLICSMSTFFSFDSSDNVGDLIKSEGRGLVNCKNDQGFATEVPVYADLEARVVQTMRNTGELSFSGNSAAFVIPRELGQLQDEYEVRPFSWNDPASQNPNVLFRGLQHDLVIEMKLSSSTQALSRIEVTRITLRFDETAPDLSLGAQ